MIHDGGVIGLMGTVSYLGIGSILSWVSVKVQKEEMFCIFAFLRIYACQTISLAPPIFLADEEKFSVLIPSTIPKSSRCQRRRQPASCRSWTTSTWMEIRIRVQNPPVSDNIQVPPSADIKKVTHTTTCQHLQQNCPFEFPNVGSEVD